jgi:hypothetical protein
MPRRKSESVAAYRKRIAKRKAETAGKSVGQQLKDTGKALKKSVVTAKNKVKDATGMARTKVKTKGGDYKVYGKDTKKAKSFRSAYAASTGKTFTWNGKKYASKGADKAPAKAKAKVKSGLKSNNMITSSDLTKNKNLKKVSPKPKAKPNFIKQVTPKLKTRDGKGVTKDDLAAIRNKPRSTQMTQAQRRLAKSDARAKAEREAKKVKNKNPRSRRQNRTGY